MLSKRPSHQQQITRTKIYKQSIPLLSIMIKNIQSNRILSNAFLIALATSGFIFTGCSDKEAKAEQERILAEHKLTIEKQKIAIEEQSQAMELAGKINEIEGKMILASVEENSFDFILHANNLQSMGKLKDNFLREKMNHEMVIKEYISGINTYLDNNSNSSMISSTDTKPTGNHYQDSINSTTKVFKVLNSTKGSVDETGKKLRDFGVKSKLIKTWTSCENRVYLNQLGIIKFILKVDSSTTKDRIDMLSKRAVIFDELATLREESPWELWTTGGSSKELQDLSPKDKMSFCSFEEIKQASRDLRAPQLASIQKSITNYFEVLENIYESIEAPSATPWGSYQNYIREQRIKVVESGQKVESDIDNFIETFKDEKKDEPIGKTMIEALPAELRGDLNKKFELNSKNK